MTIDWESLLSRAITYFFQAAFQAVFLAGTLLGLRYGLVPTHVSIKPSRRVLVRSSKNPSRRIKVHVFEPPSYETRKGALPTHVNFHGCGFVLPVFGSDAELCAYWASTLNCIVLDADYGKGTRYPHPTPVDDAMDVLRFVISEPQTFDLTRLTIGGFSSGANIAILASLRASRVKIPIKSVVAWYPPTDLTRAGEEEMSSAIVNRIHKAFRRSYLPPYIDRMDPEVSPLYADASLFPPLTLIVSLLLIELNTSLTFRIEVGEKDKLLLDATDLADKLHNEGKNCVLHTVPGAGHVWERFLKEGTPLWEERKKALSLMENRLRAAYDVV